MSYPEAQHAERGESFCVALVQGQALPADAERSDNCRYTNVRERDADGRTANPAASKTTGVAEGAVRREPEADCASRSVPGPKLARNGGDAVGVVPFGW